MSTRNEPGSGEWVDPDDAPELTVEMLDEAEWFIGDKFVKRGRGRPPTGNAKEQVSLRLDQAVLAKLREVGPGWQTQVNGLLRIALRLDRPLRQTAAESERRASAKLAGKMAVAIPSTNLPVIGEKAGRVHRPARAAHPTAKAPNTAKPASSHKAALAKPTLRKASSATDAPRRASPRPKSSTAI